MAQQDTRDIQAQLPAEESQKLAGYTALPHLLLQALDGENGSTSSVVLFIARHTSGKAPDRLEHHRAATPEPTDASAGFRAYRPCVIMLKAFPNSGPNIISTASTTIATKIRIKVYSIKACPCSPDRVL